MPKHHHHRVKVAAWLAALLAGGLALARPETGLVFSHLEHAQVAIGCEACHPRAASSAAGGDNLLPGPEACAQCHDQAECAGYGCAALEGEPPARVTAFSPQFSHAAHLGQGTACDRCHQELAAADSIADNQLPPPTACLECHDIKELLPENHRPEEWIIDHVFDYSLDGGVSCQVCHSNQSCQRCHLGEVLLRP